MVRGGCFGSWPMSRAASMTIPHPAPSSIAPVPRSQESRCAPRSTISSGLPLPRISPITLADSASGRWPQVSVKRTRTGKGEGTGAARGVEAVFLREASLMPCFARPTTSRQ